jgi:hypothetical protein
LVRSGEERLGRKEARRWRDVEKLGFGEEKGRNYYYVNDLYEISGEIT